MGISAIKPIFLFFILVMSQSLPGCVEEVCGDVIEVNSLIPEEAGMMILLLSHIPCEKMGPNTAGVLCYVVKFTAILVEGITEFCTGYSFMSEQASEQKEVVIGVWEAGKDYVIGDEKEDLQEFEMLSYVVEDDFSEASWEFTVDEEGNIYHFF